MVLLKGLRKELRNELVQDNASDYWVVDSGASCHAIPHRKLFHDYVQGDFGHVLLGDNEPSKIVGKGKVWIEFNLY